MLLLARAQLPDVELVKIFQYNSVSNTLATYLELAPLENVSISPSRLARPAGDSSMQTTSSELALKEGVNLRIYKRNS